jgi:hypothetical protein
VRDGTSAVGESRHRIPRRINRLNLGLSEQIGAGLREPDERSTLVHHQPAALDRHGRPIRDDKDGI